MLERTSSDKKVMGQSESMKSYIRKSMSPQNIGEAYSFQRCEVVEMT